MRRSFATGTALWCAAVALTACYSSTSNPVATASTTPSQPPPSATPTPTPTPMPSGPTPTPTPVPTGPTPTPTATAQPQVVHIGFELKEHTDKTYGPVWYYSPVLGNQANVVFVTHGSLLVFANDEGGSLKTQHTASGLGSSGFPSSFDNTSGFTQNGTTIDSSLTWSSGTLNPPGHLFPHGQMSQVFTVGPPGVYYFGCNFHYIGVPTKNNFSMGDVIVSQ